MATSIFPKKKILKGKFLIAVHLNFNFKATCWNIPITGPELLTGLKPQVPPRVPYFCTYKDIITQLSADKNKRVFCKQKQTKTFNIRTYNNSYGDGYIYKG